VNAVVAAALRNRALVLVLMLCLFGARALAFARLNIEAYPDPVPPLVDIIAQSPGQSAEEIERYITIPVEVQMADIPHITSVRSISPFGLADVKVQFIYDFSYQEAEQWVINRLAQMPPLPNNVTPAI
jgi:cobalt-zinc-cadmium resistance protein CzcA